MLECTVTQSATFHFSPGTDPQAAIRTAIDMSGQSDFEKVMMNDPPTGPVVQLTYRQRANVVPLVLHSSGRHGADAIVTKGAE